MKMEQMLNDIPNLTTEVKRIYFQDELKNSCKEHLSKHPTELSWLDLFDPDAVSKALSHLDTWQDPQFESLTVSIYVELSKLTELYSKTMQSLMMCPFCCEPRLIKDGMREEEDYIICKKCQFKITFPDMKTIGDRYNEEKKK